MRKCQELSLLLSLSILMPHNVHAGVPLAGGYVEILVVLWVSQWQSLHICLLFLLLPY